MSFLNARRAGKPRKMRPCAFCADEQLHVFCDACWSLLDGRSKRSFRNLRLLGATKLAITNACATLEKLKASGVRTGERSAA